MTKVTWTKEKIVEQINEMISSTGLNRMPTNSEVIAYFGNHKLSNAISKRKMWKPLAEELGLKVKESETYFGKRHEEVASEQLIELGYEVRRMPQNFPYDLLVDDLLKVDVKSSKLYRGKYGNFYSVNIDKPYATCDVYMIYLIEDDGSVKTVLIIPSKDVITNTQISIGQHASKYYKYENNWACIDDYIKTISSL